MVANNNSNELSLTRVYDAPVGVVWDAWTDPDKAAKWWGPRGFTLTTHRKDLRPGGIWHYTMHGPDGTDYPNMTVYHVVEPEKKLVYDHGGYRDRPPMFRVTVLFSEVDGETTMQMTMAFPTAEEAAATKIFIKQAGGNATWDRLAEYLAETGQRRNQFVINRSFAAPIDRVFEMWIEPDHLSKWLPPSGFDMTFIRSEIRADESVFFRMSNGDFSLHAVFEYLEVTPPTRIVYVQKFCDADEQASRHPGLPEFPSSMKTTIQLVADCDETTRVTVVSEMFDGATATEIDVFRNERSGMTLGWTGSFDALETLLASSNSAEDRFHR